MQQADSPTRLDMLIIGAGPAGLYAAYYAGFRGMAVGVMDSLPELGGQDTARLPVKIIYDVAGLPAIKGQDLVDALAEQAATAHPTYLLGHRAEELKFADEHVEVVSHRGLRVEALTVLITGGIGTFSPRRLPDSDDYASRAGVLRASSRRPQRPGRPDRRRWGLGSRLGRES